MIIEGFQPIGFKICDNESQCKCGNSDCSQLAIYEDYISFQLSDNDYFLQSNTILNGDFATNDLTNWNEYDNGGQSWDASTGEACVQALSKILWQAQTITECKCYRGVFDLLTDIPEGCQLDIILDDGTDTWTEVIETFTNIQASDDIAFGFCPTQTWQRIGFRFSGDDCGEGDFCIDNIELRELEIDAEIIDCCNDSIIDTLEDCDFSMGATNIIFYAKWSDYVNSKACYKIRINDVNYILNGDFESDLSNWTQSDFDFQDWDWNASGARANLDRDEISEILSQDFDIDLTNCSVTLTYDITSIRDNIVYLYINGEIVQTSNYTGGSGTVTYSYTIDDIYNLVSIGFQAENDDTFGGALFLSDVEMLIDLNSECICVDESFPFCTQLIRSRHRVDTTQFDFESNTDFYFNLRVKSRIVNPRYPNEIDNYLSSCGVNTKDYSRGEKIWQYQVDRIPEYVLDAIQSLFNFDETWIDGIRYVSEIQDFDPNWSRGNTSLASILIEIKRHTENRVAN